MIAEVTETFLWGLKTTTHEFKTQLAEVEAWGSCKFSECSANEACPERRILTKNRNWRSHGADP